jgi:hypothetical protein
MVIAGLLNGLTGSGDSNFGCGGVGGGSKDAGISEAGIGAGVGIAGKPAASPVGPITGRAVVGGTSGGGGLKSGIDGSCLLNSVKSAGDGPPIPNPPIGGPTVVGGSLSISGVPNALNKDCILKAPVFKSAIASDPLFEICSSDTSAKFSVTVAFSALEAYNNNPIIPNTIIIVVPGFIVS